VAVLRNCVEEVRSFSAGQLQVISTQISREMRLLKQSFIDPVTGLLNGKAMASRMRNLQEAFSPDQEPAVFSLLLVELYPRAADANQALSAIKKSATFLSSLVGHLAVPCHLGSSIFGLVWEGIGEEEALRTADLMLRWLKRENFPRGHIGITASDIESTDPGKQNDFFEQAWRALEIARKRSSFALCSYRSVSDHYVHPLRPLPDQIMVKLRRLWKDSSEFGLVQLHIDDSCSVDSIVDLFSSYIKDKPHIEIAGGDFLVFLDGYDEDTTVQWCKRIQKAMANKGINVSMGIALHPCPPFRKGDMPGNCRRALLHTAFYGPGSMTVFDAVSLNISGDVYYNEGDLSQAVKEYKKGRILDPDNTNLMNSLGVTFANMSKYGEAVLQFEEVLARDKKNFMALYNKGFAHLALHDKEKALHYLERAYQVDDTHFELLFQLGKLYCQKRQYSDAVKVLEQGESLGPKKVSDVSHGAVYRYLGEAYNGVGERENAIISLQRATRYNPSDSIAISMLGELYSAAREGDDIAVSLCREAVTLEPQGSDNWLRLGKVLMRQEDIDGAVESFEQGLECDRKHSSLCFFLGQAYEKMGKEAGAIKMYKATLKIRPDHKKAASAVKCLMGKKKK
jgi:tetratricopeptide (TPR) repeat protein